MSADWYNLGLQLKVRTGDLNGIRAQIGTPPKNHLRDMLSVWLTTGDDPSWMTLTDALRSRSVGANRLADTVEQKYCPVEETEVDMDTSASDCLPETNFPPPSVSEPVIPTLQPRVADVHESK